MIRVAAILLLPLVLCAQPTIATQMRNGVVRAVVLHAADLTPVTDDSPAHPGESLILQGSGFGADIQVMAGPSTAATAAIDDGDAQFTLPDGAGGSFIAITAVSGGAMSNTASLPSSATVDSTQLAASEVQTLALTTASIATGDHLAISIVDRNGNPLAIYTRPSATISSDIEKAPFNGPHGRVLQQPADASLLTDGALHQPHQLSGGHPQSAVRSSVWYREHQSRMQFQHYVSTRPGSAAATRRRRSQLQPGNRHRARRSRAISQRDRR